MIDIDQRRLYSLATESSTNLLNGAKDQRATKDLMAALFLIAHHD